ncbi:TKL protein kinase [Saprolegnia parasitica CBS 223.65]|uniref:TKL protein kinase n=1 Tax=Saprolegnia parasitica (strain CBS 223.65) TaxID=695850 RepID=A0A067CAQ1_SAPPC|nr:TKL protein kinase [Saprolegnia parasitica CBS 223.65]KDO26225.1 TKL protein kinase [Saprolegnia parasitica CBS 223.65]|eukprot:XP_012202934.1 TKL protein kinase [Saprolegnia parasitica CBS 223.65]
MADSSDFVSRFQALYKANAVSSVSTLSHPKVLAQLTPFMLKWDSLPTLLQQAMLWDLGLVIATVNGAEKLVQVYPLCSASMDNLFFPPAAFLSLEGTSPQICPSAAYTNYTRQYVASGPGLMPAIRCAIDASGVPDGQSAMYAQDALGASDVPEPRSWVILAIHSLPKAYGREAAWGNCPDEAQKQRSALTIPCVVYSSRTASFCEPRALSPAMTSWLKAYANPTSATAHIIPDPSPARPASVTTTEDRSSAVLIGAIAGVVGGLILAILLILVYRRRTRRSEIQFEPFEPPPISYATTRGDTIELMPHNYRALETPRSILCVAWSTHTVLDDASALRVDMTGFVATTQLSTSVVAGTLHHQSVVVKYAENDVNLDAFVQTISLQSTLKHRNIVAFLGFGYDPNDKGSLCVVAECLPFGTLEAFLRDQMGWFWEAKMSVALDVAQGLHYLHDRSVLAPRLRSRHILLMSHEHAKLANFRLTNHVAKPDVTYWTAPEVVRGEAYSSAADMYALGCVFAELDTHRRPYADVPLPAATIASRVVTTGLRPSFTGHCPVDIRKLADECLLSEPDERPTASEVAAELTKILRYHRGSGCVLMQP